MPKIHFVFECDFCHSPFASETAQNIKEKFDMNAFNKRSTPVVWEYSL